MFSHARVSRRMSRRASSNGSPAPLVDLRKSSGSRTPSVYSQAITIQDEPKDSTPGAEKPHNSSSEAPTSFSSSGQSNYKYSINGLYFNTLSELADWYNSYESTSDLYDSLRIPREDYSLYKRFRPTSSGLNINLSVCHDFKNNYLPNEDNSPLGYFPHVNGKHYFLQFPGLVDHFIYFSHHLVTVPTVSWINFCHRFGMQCLGTIIVEGNSTEKFKQLSKLCAKNQDNEYIYVKMLIRLLEHYRFDGYLINIETRFLNHSESFEIINFLQQLKVSVHVSSPNAKVIWYDSFVPSLNKIKYENGVSPLNYELFKSSDYFLTNYWWDENTLKKNVAIAGLHGVNSSLYVGIDMWGRGSKVGNGGYDAPIAINFSKAYDSNVCLFAPAWTYEYLGQDGFLENDQKLWRTDGENDTISSFIDSYTAACYYPFGDSKYLHDTHSKKYSFIFYTNFSNGQGKFFSINGNNVFNNYWVNTNFQHEIPDIALSSDKNSKRNNGYNLLNFSIDKDEAFNGGSCLKIVKNNNLFIINDGESLSDLHQELVNRPLFRFANDCRSENLRIKLNYKYNIINNEMLTLFNSTDKDTINSSVLGSNIWNLVDGFFQLDIMYAIERRYKSVHKVNEGSLSIPLEIDKPSANSSKNSFLETDWKLVDLTFPTPKGIKWEYCVLTSVNISWISHKPNGALNGNGFTDLELNEDKIFSKVYKVNENSSIESSISDRIGLTESTSHSELLDSDNEEWIILPDNSSPSSFTELYIGDLSVTSIFNEDTSSFPSSYNRIKSLEEVKSINKDSIYIKWSDFSNNLTKAAYFNVFVNDEFVGVSFFNSWVIDSKSLAVLGTKQVRIRVDIVSRIGDVIHGDSIVVKP